MRVTRLRTTRGVRLVVLAVISTAAASAFPVAAAAVPGDLSYQGCITGQTESGPGLGNSGACAAIAPATAGGVNSGLDRLESVAVSPEGNSVYVAAGQQDDGVARFDRDPATGALAYAGCFSGDTSNTGCTPIAGATADGENSGLNWPESVAVSPDGRSVYLTSRFDHAIAQFSRDPATGALSYIGCDSGEDESVPPCDAIGLTTSGGDNSGFADPKAKATVFSADGRFVYAAGERDDSIVIFDRDTTTGALSFDSCLTGETESSPPCTDIPDAASLGDNSGLDQPRWLLIGPEDTSLYAVADLESAIARFSRNPATGALTFQDCLTGDTSTGPGGSGACDQIPSATVGGNDSGFDNARAMAISPDGEFAYAVAGDDDAVSTLDRDPATGAIAYVSCMTAEVESGPSGTGACSALPAIASFGNDSGFSDMRSIAISADGVSLYTAAQSDDALANFDRDLATGALTFDSCLTGDADVACTPIASAAPGGTASGLDNLETIVLSADGRSLYGAAEDGDAVSRFGREPVPELAGCQGATVTKTNGSAGDDQLTGTEATDAIFGAAGNDLINGVGGSDCLFGDDGNDKLKGGGGKDRESGGAGKDNVRGQGGKDRLKGDDGNDKLNGGKGKDRLKGGAGKDRVKAVDGKVDKVNCQGGKDKVTVDAEDKVKANCEKVKVKG